MHARRSVSSFDRPLRAFTLVELMIVVAIIGLLAALAIPSYARFQCRARQTEAKTVLKQIQVAEESYRAENDGYLHGAPADAAILGQLGVLIAGPRRRYSYSVPLGPGPTEFDAYADALVGRGMDGDQWTINQEGVLENTFTSPLCD